MAGSKNVIRKTTFDFHFDGNADGILLQQEATKWCRNELIASLDSVLDDYEFSDEVIYIENILLEIDLGQSPDWKKELSERIRIGLKEQIRSKISLKSGDVHVKSLSARIFETFFYYLKHGFLPWYSTIKTLSDFETQTGKWLGNLPPSEIEYLLLQLRDEKSIFRFVHLLSQHDFEVFTAAAVNDPDLDLSLLFEDVKLVTGILAGDKFLHQKLMKDFNEMLVARIADGPKAGFPETFLTIWFSELALIYPDEVWKIRVPSIKTPEMVTIITRVQEKLERKGSGLYLKKVPEKKEIIEEAGHEEGEDIISRRVDDKKEKGAIRKSEKPDDESGKELEEGVFISNAGAVIIAPFLPALFSRTGLMEVNRITDTSAALCLLHYCLTGNREPAEFELLLPKILCGADPGSIVEMTSIPDKNMMKEADEMLASVIEYWSVLKNTSVEGLREAFLLRNGRLSFADDEWQLSVEQRTYDMLLEHLPWNISIIMLPWMRMILRTNWI